MKFYKKYKPNVILSDEKEDWEDEENKKILKKELKKIINIEKPIIKVKTQTINSKPIDTTKLYLEL